VNIFDPGNAPNYKEMMGIARKANAQRDQVDRMKGVMAPPDEADAAFLRTAISAIVTGIETAQWSCVCEGLDMLQQAELRIRERTTTTRGG